MDHNIVIVDGAEYKAVKCTGGCLGCSFYKDACTANNDKGVSCVHAARPDGRDVIFKPHYRLINGKPIHAIRLNQKDIACASAT